MDQREQEQRPVRREYGSSAAADSIGQARRVIDQLEARINDARRVPMSKTLSIVDAGELIDLIGQLRIVLPHTVVQAQAILEQQKQILGDAKAEADRTADKADEIYTTTVEKPSSSSRRSRPTRTLTTSRSARRRRRIPTRSLRTRTPAPTRSSSAPSSNPKSWWMTTKSPAARRLTPWRRVSAPKRTRTASTTRPARRWTRCSPARRPRFPEAPASWRRSETVC